MPINLTNKTVSSLPEGSFDIVVFDILPVRTAKQIEFGVFNAFMDNDFYVSFLNKIIKVAEQTNKTIIYKTKRCAVRWFSKRVDKYLESFTSHPLVTAVNPDVAAHLIIKNYSGRISILFTSMAKIVAHLKNLLFF